MQYEPGQGDHPQNALERFLKEMGVDAVEPVDRFSVKKSDLRESVQIVILQP
jgi:hypothetical protein